MGLSEHKESEVETELRRRDLAIKEQEAALKRQEHELRVREIDAKLAEQDREYKLKTRELDIRFVRWAERSIWEDLFATLAGDEDAPDRLFLVSSCIKVHRCAGGAKAGLWLMVSVAPKAAATPRSMPSVTPKAALTSCS